MKYLFIKQAYILLTFSFNTDHDNVFIIFKDTLRNLIPIIKEELKRSKI